jgi:uncharacterized protein YndB with AHSA1/START domain
MAASGKQAETTIRITRVFKAPVARVFRACIDPAQLRQWWCPEGYKFTDVTIDPKTGYGKRYTMIGEAGDKYVWDIVYSLVDEPKKLKWESIPVEGFGETGTTRAMLEFREVPGGTEVTLTHEGFPDQQTRDAHQGGWAGGFDKLEKMLAKGK